MPRRSLISLALILSACSTVGGSGTSTPAAPATAVSTTAVAVPVTTTTVLPPDTAFPGIYSHLTATDEYLPGLGVDIHAPGELGPWPVVVTIHGGGWVAGNRQAMGLLADGLADRGIVAFNASYRTIVRGGRFPDTVEDVACAIGFARDHAGDYTTTPDRVVVIGHSAGAHLAALTALAPTEFSGDCPWDTRGPDGLVGLAGPYNTDQLSFLLAPFFGTQFSEDPEPWTRGNPLTYVAGEPDIPILLVHGDADQTAPLAFSEEFAQALSEAGKSVDLQILRGVDHGTVNDPRVVGDLIAAFVAVDQ